MLPSSQLLLWSIGSICYNRIISYHNHIISYHIISADNKDLDDDDDDDVDDVDDGQIQYLMMDDRGWNVDETGLDTI